ncbi:MAG: outer membrane lipoprotein carrier protein LolA [Rhizobiaceae bacterium]
MTMTKMPADFTQLTRRAFVAATAGLFLPAAFGTASAAAASSPQKIADHFSSVKTLTGEFVQFGPRGEQTGGTFYISRPGKIRFNYEKPSPIRVVADGKSVVVNNKKLDTWDVYPLNKTPLKLLLSEKIELTGERIKSVKEEADLTTIIMGDKSIFGNSTITLMFDPASFDLKQWTITDAQGLDTTVMIFNTKAGVKFDPKLFEIDYGRVRDSKNSKKN